MLFKEREENSGNWKSDEVRGVNESECPLTFNGSLPSSDRFFIEALGLDANYTSIQYYRYFGLIGSVLQSLREEFFAT